MQRGRPIKGSRPFAGRVPQRPALTHTPLPPLSFAGRRFVLGLKSRHRCARRLCKLTVHQAVLFSSPPRPSRSRMRCRNVRFWQSCPEARNKRLVLKQSFLAAATENAESSSARSIPACMRLSFSKRPHHRSSLLSAFLLSDGKRHALTVMQHAIVNAASAFCGVASTAYQVFLGVASPCSSAPEQIAHALQFTDISPCARTDTSMVPTSRRCRSARPSSFHARHAPQTHVFPLFTAIERYVAHTASLPHINVRICASLPVMSSHVPVFYC